MTSNPNDPALWENHYRKDATAWTGDAPFVGVVNDQTEHLQTGEPEQWFFWNGSKWSAFSQLAPLWSAGAAMRNRMGLLALEPELRKLAEESYEVTFAACNENQQRLAAEIVDTISVLLGVAQERGVSPEMLESEMRQRTLDLDRVTLQTHELDAKGVLRKKSSNR